MPTPMQPTNWLALVPLIAASLVAGGDNERAERDPSERMTLATGTVVELFGDARSGAQSYSIRTADGRTSGRRVLDPTIRLRRGAFDPLVDERPASLVPGSGSARLVQFETQALEEYVDALATLGADVHRFVSRSTVVATIPSDAESSVRALAFVRWVGAYRPDERIEDGLLRAYVRDELRGSARYLIQVMRRGLADKRAVADAIRSGGGRVDALTATGFLLRAELTRAQLESIASHDAVFWIEREADVMTFTNKARIVGGANLLEQATGFTGQGVRGEIADEGIFAGHPGFQSNPLLFHGAANGDPSHGTKVMGVAFGDGTNQPAGRGILPDGQPIFTAFSNLLADRYTTTSELLGAPYRAVFQSNSWGTGPSGPSYPSLAFELDDVILQYDVVTLQSMGNGGGTTGAQQAWAKNVVSVGAVWHLDTTTLDDDFWAGAGTRGPAQDGRIKPDICFWYDKLLTANQNGLYSNFGGTSASTPLVAGHFGLFFQMWHDEVFGNVAPGASVFASRPRSATARAFVANTARAYDFAGAGHDLTRTHQDWGRPHVFDMHERGNGVLVVDETQPLVNLQSASYEVVVAPGQTELRATLVFTDPAGSSSAMMNSLNDLTLRLTSPSSVVYWGNHGLDVGNVSTAGGSANTVDTTEQVWLENPESGVWKVDVSADTIVADARLESPAIDADFGLVVGPVAPVAADIGESLPSTGGPELSFRGYLTANTAWRFELENAPPSSRAVLLLGTTQLKNALARGKLVPRPNFQIEGTTSASGTTSFPGFYAGGIPAGTRLYAQVWIHDVGGSQTYSASNALEFRVP